MQFLDVVLREKLPMLIVQFVNHFDMLIYRHLEYLPNISKFVIGYQMFFETNLVSTRSNE